MYKRVEKICEHCNCTYQGTKLSKYCGYECAKFARRKRVICICQHCNKEFNVPVYRYKAKFCSAECKNKSQSSVTIKIACDNCHKLFDRKEHRVRGEHSFCSLDCHNQFNTGSNHYEWKEDLHDKHHVLALKQWGRQVKERDSYTCQMCGETNRAILEAHHIKHRSTHPELQFDYDNGTTLCLKCHSLQHLDEPKALRLIKSKLKNGS